MKSGLDRLSLFIVDGLIDCGHVHTEIDGLRRYFIQPKTVNCQSTFALFVQTEY